MGTPASVVPVLHRLHAMLDLEVVAAVTPPDRTRGRGRQPEPPPVKATAQEMDIPVLQPRNLRGESTRSELEALVPDVIVVAAFGMLLPAQILALPPGGCLNLHPSLLPRHRGPSPVATAILEADRTTGVSLMLLDEGMDTGPVIARSEIELTATENAGDLTARLFDLGGQLLEDCIGPWVTGDLKSHPQDVGLATVTRKLERADGLVDWTLSAEALVRQCRAFAPWPGLYTEWQGKSLKLLEVSIRPGEQPRPVGPGKVMPDGSASGLFVATGNGLLALNRLQLEGRRPVSGEEFLRGHPEILGATLGA